MLELVLKLLEHLHTLLKMRDAGNRATFEDHIQPIYRDIKTVYDDYTAAFKATRHSLINPDVPLDSIIQELRAKRDFNPRLRQELVSYSEIFQESGRFPQEFKTFCDHTSSIILKEPTILNVGFGPRTTQMGTIIKFLELWSNKLFREVLNQDFASETDFRKFAAGSLDLTLNNMADHWQLVMKSYFELRVKYLKPA
jgi:hypothetical protein